MMRVAHIVTGLRAVAFGGVAMWGGAQGLAAETYTCDFTRECIGDELCHATSLAGTTFRRSGEAWVVEIPGSPPVGFTEMGVAREGAIRVVSNDIDPDADAAAMLSVAQSGKAILSIHGYFPELGVVTHLGTCLPEGG